MRGVVMLFSLAVGLGFGITSASSFVWLALVGQPGLGYFTLEFALGIIFLCVAFFRLRTTKATAQGKMGEPSTGEAANSLLRTSFFVLLALSVVWFFIHSILHPHPTGDATSIWNLRARFLFLSGENWQSSFSDALAWSHPDYPLMIPGSIFRAWRIVGHETAIAPYVVAALFTFATFCLLFTSVSTLQGKNKGYLSALTIFATYGFFTFGASQYADLPVGHFILATLVLFVLGDSQHYHPLSLPFLAGVTTSCALWTKNEGFLFLVAVCLMLFARAFQNSHWRSYLSKLLLFVLGLLPILAVTMFFKNFTPPNDLVNYGTLQSVHYRLADWTRYIEVGSAFVKHTLTFGGGIVFFLFAYWFFSGTNRDPKMKKALFGPSLSLLTMLCGFFFIYITTSVHITYYISTSFDRLFLQLWPSAVFLFFLFVEGSVGIPSRFTWILSRKRF
jgi:hypothetical protein